MRVSLRHWFTSLKHAIPCARVGAISCVGASSSRPCSRPFSCRLRRQDADDGHHRAGPQPAEQRPSAAAGGDDDRPRQLPDRRRCHARRPLLLDRLDRPRAATTSGSSRVRTKEVVQVVPMPGASGGIAMDPSRAARLRVGRRRLRRRPRRPAAARACPGREGDVIHVFRYSTHDRPRDASSACCRCRRRAAPRRRRTSRRPTRRRSRGRTASRSRPTARTLLVPLNLADQRGDRGRRRPARSATSRPAATRTARRSRRTAAPASSRTRPPAPCRSSTSPPARSWATSTLGHLTHPEAIAIDPPAARAYVAVANGDRVAVIDIAAPHGGRLALDRAVRPATAPRPTALDADAATATRLLVAESGADELSVFRTGRRLAAWDGSRPPPTRPTCASRRTAARSLWISGKGLGTGPNLNGPNPFETTDANTNSFEYLPIITFGKAGVLRFPSDERDRGADGRSPTRSCSPRTRRPRRPARRCAPDGPIKHVFYVVKENRTYDQVLGDDARGDGDPSLTLFGDTTRPTLHALVRRFPLLDHVYANSEASIDGHFWTSAAKVSDYVEKNWFQNYGGRGRPYDFGVYAVTFPQNGFLFDQADRDGVSWFNYGEAIAGVVGVFPDKDRTPDVAADETAQAREVRPRPERLLRRTTPPSARTRSPGRRCSTRASRRARRPARSRASTASASASRRRSRPARCRRSTTSCMTNDHTRGLEPGARTPQAMMADNDLGARADRRPDLALVDLVVVGDLRGRGRLAGRRRPRRRAPHAGSRDLALRAPRRGRPQPLRPALDDPLDRADPRHAPARPVRRARDADVRRVRLEARPTPSPTTRCPRTSTCWTRNANTAANRALSAGLDLNTASTACRSASSTPCSGSRSTGATATPPPPGPNAEGEERGDDD